MDILNNTIKKISPSQKETDELNYLFREIKKYILSKYNINAELMGSVAKNTFLKNNNDLDIFIFFDKSTSLDDLEKEALQIGKDAFEHFDGSWQIDYASHPYTKGKIRNYKVEIVPCYKIKSIKEMISAVDRTPFHTKYIIKNLEPARRKDVLLLKQFLKTINCYGSDLKTKGFAGYLCELLIIKYKTFEGVLNEFSDLKRNTIISLSNSLNNTKKIIEKFDAPFIFLDPVDKNRNVAASLSIDVLLRTKYYSQQYLQNPGEIYFNPTKFEKKTASKKSLKSLLENRHFYVLCFEKPDLIEDILYPQLERFKNSLEKYVLSKEFHLNDCFFDCCPESNLCIIGFDFLTDDLSCFCHRRGPDIFAQKEKTEGFLNKHKNAYLSNGNYMCFEKRKITNACDLINSVKKKEAQKQIAIPKEIEKTLNKSFCVLDIKRIEEYVKSNKISSNVICRNIAGGKTI
ncbi:MAG: CCA tRNA nucleotidyltransferase [Candidatus Aenigmarchaeota archaeon]|nr:CCA tRNA nucleotidyltransferase [Candidatus Aenigmarchaeota archaeon]MCK5177546.1 CCA tRNA nucleotidyltransferase [Candidatus Aenigmarchaeota archaeon]